MANEMFSDHETRIAYEWLTKPYSIQVRMLESAMRNYNDPVYDPSNVGKHLVKALQSPMGGYTGDVFKVKIIVLAIAIIDHSKLKGWDVVKEK